MVVYRVWVFQKKKSPHSKDYGMWGSMLGIMTGDVFIRELARLETQASNKSIFDDLYTDYDSG